MELDYLDKELLEQYKKEAEELGISLTERLLFQVLKKMEDLYVTAYIDND